MFIRDSKIMNQKIIVPNKEYFQLEFPLYILNNIDAAEPKPITIAVPIYYSY